MEQDSSQSEPAIRPERSPSDWRSRAEELRQNAAEKKRRSVKSFIRAISKRMSDMPSNVNDPA